jgi:hypothetical protein
VRVTHGAVATLAVLRADRAGAGRACRTVAGFEDGGDALSDGEGGSAAARALAGEGGSRPRALAGRG